MHTSTRLTAADFSYRRVTSTEDTPLTFSEFCPAYHELDRVGVVSPALEDGVLQTGRTLLALTTAFYDCLRRRDQPFFDYPQHFAFVSDSHAGNVHASDNHSSDSHAGVDPSPQQWDAWSWLDVWPANKWITTPATAGGTLQAIFDYQINRLFWPHGLRPLPGEGLLQDHVYRMLRTRLKTVTYFERSGHLDHTLPILEVSGSEAVETLVQESSARLPSVITQRWPSPAPKLDRLQPVPVAEFIAAMQDQP